MTNSNSPQEFLGVTEAAAYLNISRQAFNKRTPPPADAKIGKIFGWTKPTLDAWNAAAPKVGKRAKKTPKESA